MAMALAISPRHANVPSLCFDTIQPMRSAPRRRKSGAARGREPRLPLLCHGSELLLRGALTTRTGRVTQELPDILRPLTLSARSQRTGEMGGQTDLYTRPQWLELEMRVPRPPQSKKRATPAPPAKARAPNMPAQPCDAAQTLRLTGEEAAQMLATGGLPETTLLMLVEAHPRDYLPYDLVTVNSDIARRRAGRIARSGSEQGRHYSMSRAGVVRFKNGGDDGDAEFTSLGTWLRERSMYTSLRRLRFFGKHPLLKALQGWKRFWRIGRFRAARHQACGSSSWLGSSHMAAFMQNAHAVCDAIQTGHVDEVCVACREPMEARRQLSCGHCVHAHCLSSLTQCPTCCGSLASYKCCSGTGPCTLDAYAARMKRRDEGLGAFLDEQVTHLVSTVDAAVHSLHERAAALMPSLRRRDDSESMRAKRLEEIARLGALREVHADAGAMARALRAVEEMYRAAALSLGVRGAQLMHDLVGAGRSAGGDGSNSSGGGSGDVGSKAEAEKRALLNLAAKFENGKVVLAPPRAESLGVAQGAFDSLLATIAGHLPPFSALFRGQLEIARELCAANDAGLLLRKPNGTGAGPLAPVLADSNAIAQVWHATSERMETDYDNASTEARIKYARYGGVCSLCEDVERPTAHSTPRPPVVASRSVSRSGSRMGRRMRDTRVAPEDEAKTAAAALLFCQSDAQRAALLGMASRRSRGRRWGELSHRRRWATGTERMRQLKTFKSSVSQKLCAQYASGCLLVEARLMRAELEAELAAASSRLAVDLVEQTMSKAVALLAKFNSAVHDVAPRPTGAHEFVEFISTYDRTRSTAESLRQERLACTRMFRVLDEFKCALDIRQSVIRDDVYGVEKRAEDSLAAAADFVSANYGLLSATSTTTADARSPSPLAQEKEAQEKESSSPVVSADECEDVPKTTGFAKLGMLGRNKLSGETAQQSSSPPPSPSPSSLSSASSILSSNEEVQEDQVVNQNVPSVIQNRRSLPSSPSVEQMPSLRKRLY